MEKMLESAKGYEVTLVGVVVEGSDRTVTIDDFSGFPVSLQNYSLKDFEPTENWDNVFSKTQAEFDDVCEALDWLKDVLSAKDLKRVKAKIDEMDIV